MTRTVLALVTLLLVPGCHSESTQLRARGNLLLGHGAVSGGLQCLRAAARGAPESADAALRLGQALYDAQHFSEAEAALRTAVTLAGQTAVDPSGARRTLAQVLARQGRTAEAEAELYGHLQQQQDDASANVALAWMRLYRGDAVSARAALDAALKARRPTAAALYGRGRVALHEGDLNGAAAFFETLAQLFPARPYGAYGLAIVAARRGHTGDACEHLQTAQTLGLRDTAAVSRDRELRRAGALPCMPTVGAS